MAIQRSVGHANPYARPTSTCPSCGHELIRGRPRCGRCGQRVGGGPTRASGAAYDRPGVITVLSVLFFLSGGVMLLVTPFLIFASLSEPSANPFMATAALCGMLGLVYVVGAFGLWQLKSYGRTLAIVFSAFGLLGFPLGTVISILILVYLFKPGIKILFSERPLGQLSSLELAELQKVQTSSAATVAVVAILLVLFVVAGIGIIAAIAIPSLLRARVAANEAQTIGDLRTMISAQETYASANYGYFDTAECLMQPDNCIPDYPPAAPKFLGEDLSGVKSGYQRTLHLGPPPEGNLAGERTISRSSVTSFAFVAVPVTPGTTGVRSFCADASGVVCMTGAGIEPTVVNGTCAPTCEPF